MIGLAARIITSTKRWNKCANEMGGVGVTEDKRWWTNSQAKSSTTERAADAAKSIFPREEVNDVDI